MIDWFPVFANAFWIIACALALGALSHAFWQARLSGGALRSYLTRPAFQAAWCVAGLLLGIGLASVAASWWEKTAGVVLALLFAA